MARIYKCTDRIPVKIDGILVKLAPLNLDQKIEIQTLMAKGRRDQDLKSATLGFTNSIKYSVKAISGLVDGDGNPYSLGFDENKNLSDECVSDLLNIEITPKLSLICASLVNGISSEFTDERGLPIQGVEFIKTNSGEPSGN